MGAIGQLIHPNVSIGDGAVIGPFVVIGEPPRGAASGELEHEKELLTRDQLDPSSVYGTSHRAVIVDMIEAIREGRPPKTNGREARRSVALVLAIYESARTGRPVDMTDGIWNGQD